MHSAVGLLIWLLGAGIFALIVGIIIEKMGAKKPVDHHEP